MPDSPVLTNDDYAALPTIWWAEADSLELAAFKSIGYKEVHSLTADGKIMVKLLKPKSGEADVP